MHHTPAHARPAAASARRLTAALLLVLAMLAGGISAARADTALTVAQALARQDGSTATVTGVIVGQPTGPSTVVTSGFADDYSLAIADAAGTPDPSRTLYVQITSSFRSGWGLKSNPSRLGGRVTITGTLSSYFSHGGLKSTTAFTGGSTPTATPTPSSSPTASPTATPTGDPGDYYADAAGLTGSQLKSALHEIIDDNTRLSYDQVWNGIKATDEDPANANNVITLYSGLSLPKSNNGGGPDQWNREHTWAKSHGDFGTATGPGTDLHHLRAEDVTVNSTRGNLDFDEGGSPVAEAPANNVDGDSFEPRDEVKGDIARMMFYMAVRYDGDDGFADLELNDQVGNGSRPNIGRLSVLLEWNAEDPVSATEVRRNEIIYSQFQHNRNPFIDHPEYAEQIW